MPVVGGNDVRAETPILERVLIASVRPSLLRITLRSPLEQTTAMTSTEPEPNNVASHKHLLHLHGHRPKQRPSMPSRFSQFDITHDEFNTRAFVDHDGRIHIDFKKLKEGPLSMFLSGENKSFPVDGRGIVGEEEEEEEEEVPAPPKLNIVVMVIGSRGDVQPFVAVSKVLAKQGGHRVRLATHPAFRDFVEENGVEFFDVGGDPAELMAFMVKNPVSCSFCGGDGRRTSEC